MSSDLPRDPRAELKIVSAPARSSSVLRLGAAELAASYVGWKARVPLPNSIGSILEAAASYDFRVVDDLGGPAFKMHHAERRLDFCGASLDRARLAGEEIGRDLDVGDTSFVTEMGALAQHLFLFHELTHIPQNVGEFSNVQLLKKFSPLHVAILDLLADIAAIHAAACIDCAKTGTTSPKAFAHASVRNALFSYATAVKAFGISSEAKKARYLGILFTAAATHALQGDALNLETTNSILAPPILPMVVPETGEFNGLLILPEPRLLLPESIMLPKQVAQQLWNEIPTTRAEDMLTTSYSALALAGVVKAAG